MASKTKKGQKGEPEGQQIVGDSSEEELELETGDRLSAMEWQMAEMEATNWLQYWTSSRWQATPKGRLKWLQGRGNSQ